MNHHRSSQLSTWLQFFGVLFVSVAAFAGPSHMREPVSQDPGMRHGFPPSLHLLTDAAELTAFFNVGPRTVDTYPANLPFQILYAPSPTDLNNTGGQSTTFYM